MGVSVDLFATVQRPVGFELLVATARATIRRLLALDVVPAIDVFADEHDGQGRRLRPGRRLAASELTAETIGGRMSAGCFDFRVATSGDLARFFVAPDEGMLDAVFTPTRTCVGVVVATALALATALHGCGEFIDLEIRMLDPGESDPEAMIEQTRLVDPGADFAAQCERYMRQFARLNGWPRDVSLVG